MQGEPYNIVNRNNREADIVFHGEIARWGKQNVSNFLHQLKEMEGKYDTVNLRIHSGGGAVFEGFAIINAIHQSKMEFHGYVDGLAASMAAVLLMVCKKRYMNKNSLLMIHSASGWANGTAVKMRSTADLLDKVSDILFENIKAATNKTDEEIAKLNNGEDHWFNPTEALAEGFIDEIIDSGEEESKVPENYTALGVEQVYNQYNISNHTNQPKIKDNMKKQLITALALVGVSAESDDDAVILSVQNQLQAAESEVETLQASVSAKDAQLQTLEDKLKAFEADRLKALLDQGEKDKKFTAKDRAIYEKVAENSGFDAVKQLVDSLKIVPNARDYAQEEGRQEEEETTPTSLEAQIAQKLSNIENN